MLLINCEINPILTWSEMIAQVAVPAQQNNPARLTKNYPTSAAFKIITDTEVCVPAVTLSNQGNNKLLEQLKTGFKRTIKWKKYR